MYQKILVPLDGSEPWQVSPVGADYVFSEGIPDRNPQKGKWPCPMIPSFLRFTLPRVPSSRALHPKPCLKTRKTLGNPLKGVGNGLLR